MLPISVKICYNIYVLIYMYASAYRKKNKK